MTPVLLSEIMDWKAFGSRRTILILVLSLGLACIFTMGRPDWCGVVLTADIVWFSQMAGRQIWNRIRTDEWITECHLKPLAIISGKVGGVFCINLFHLFLALPVLVMTALLWGIPAAVFGMLLVIWLLLTVCITLIALMMINLSDFFQLFSLLVLSILIVLMFSFSSWMVYNPLIQAYRLMRGESPGGYAWLAGGFLFDAVLVPVTVWVLKKGVKTS